jgi:hypothetical protein
LAVRERRLVTLWVTPEFPLLHVAYGLGTLWEVFKFGFVPIRGIRPEKLTLRESLDLKTLP